MAVAALATLNAQTTTTLVAPRLVMRPLTTGDIALYKLPSTTQVSGGLTTVALGEPFYLEVDVDATIPANNIAGVIWSIVTKPAGSNAALVASPLVAAVPVYEPSDRLVYRAGGPAMIGPRCARRLYPALAPSDHRPAAAPLTRSPDHTRPAYTGVTTAQECHNTGPAAQMVGPWSNTLHSSIFTNGINGGSGTTGTSCLACHTVGYDANNTQNDNGFSYVAKQLGWTFPTTLQPGNFNNVPATLQNLANIQCENCHGPGSEHAANGGDAMAISVPTNTGACNACHDAPSHHLSRARLRGASSIRMPSPPDPARQRQPAVGCHTGTGFIQRMNGISPITDTAYHPIDCAACHEPHGITSPANGSGDTHQIRQMGSVTLADGAPDPLYRHR